MDERFSNFEYRELPEGGIELIGIKNREVTGVNIPDGVTVIGENAFSGCGKLINVYIPESVKLIKERAFFDCPALDQVIYAGDKDSWCNLDIEKGNNKISAVFLTFEGEALSKDEVYVPKTLTSEDKKTAPKEKRHKTEKVKKEKKPKEKAKKEKAPKEKVELKAKVINLLKSKKFRAIAIPVLAVLLIVGAIFAGLGIPNNTLKIKLSKAGFKYEFNGYGDVRVTGYHGDSSTITIPKGVTSIGGHAFFECDSLTSITIPEGVTSIGDAVFCRCSRLTSITIPDSITSIGEYAFWGCTSLTSITIPDSVTSIGDYAFEYCPSLTSVYVTDIAKWCNISFDGTYANPLYYAHNLYLNGELVTELVIPEGVTSIGNSAFQGCSSLSSITLPDSVTSIGNFAFDNCTSLASITIPDSVTSIGNFAFSGCSSLTSITIPDSVTSIGKDAFYGCSSLTSITVPDSVTSIGYAAFRDCTSLTSITIPDSITSIGNYAFGYCTSLTDVYYRGTEEQWSAIEIGLNNRDLTSATIHYNYEE